MRGAALLLAAVAVAASAQTAHVRVEAEAGTVLVDGEITGVAGAWLTVMPGDRVVSLVADPRAFDPLHAEASVALAPGDSLVLPLVLPVRVRVESLPIRAVVVRERAGVRERLGETPLTVDAAPGEAILLEATLDGYAPVRRRVVAGDGPVTLVLPLGAETVPEAVLLPTQRSTVRRTLLDLGIGAATLAAGVVAISTKFEADALDDRYRAEGTPDFGDEALRQEALRLDRISATALGAMQVGLGVLAVRFVLR